MGTNFYWIQLPKELNKYKKNIDMTNEDNILMHIGKRSAAGHYCMDCGCTFHKYGTDQIHGELNAHFDIHDIEEFKRQNSLYWYDKCPVCGKEGTYICTFRWTFMKQKEIVRKYMLAKNKNKIIRNEYDETFTAEEFLKEVETPVEYQAATEFA